MLCIPKLPPSEGGGGKGAAPPGQGALVALYPLAHEVSGARRIPCSPRAAACHGACHAPGRGRRRRGSAWLPPAPPAARLQQLALSSHRHTSPRPTSRAASTKRMAITRLQPQLAPGAAQAVRSLAQSAALRRMDGRVPLNLSKTTKCAPGPGRATPAPTPVPSRTPPPLPTPLTQISPSKPPLPRAGL
jgi:hypothetical protein